jgi:16S rRNA (cytidine1402-2'-O)-methyltransferase
MSGIKLVTVPIGNKDDITVRALKAIQETRVIYSEDTRVFKELCKRLQVNYSDKEIRSFHDHSSDKVLEGIFEVAASEGCVFVSDAGSPLISDPAFPLILKAIESGVELDTYSGISSVVAALELSGLAPIPFHFHGFLARDKSKINQDIAKVKSQYGTHIFFEGKSRVIATLELMSKEFPDFKMALCRELTKEFQSVYRFKGEDFDKVKEDIFVKGEFVILVENSKKQTSASSSEELIKLAEEIISSGAKPKKLAKLLGLITGKPTKEIYNDISGTRQ